ncbi:MAG: M48 family metallopeptidase [Hyphomonadaceae bacterium]|nr:M48 family metallopeptidase [Hyphomonadaceae bacterium]
MRLMVLAGLFALAVGAPSLASAQALPFDPDLATRAWIDTIGPEALARSNAYFEGGYWIQFLVAGIGIVISMAMMVLGWAKGVRSWLEKTVKVYFLVVLGMALFYQLISTVLTFPLSWWIGFLREHQYGLSNQSFVEWFGEYAIGNAIGIVVGAVLIAVIYLVVRAAKRTWWLWASCVTIAFMAVMLMVYPVFIAPIFNAYTPMEDGPLKREIIAMAQANGVPADNVYVYDRSRQTNSISANVSGLFGTTRISLSDTLIQRESPGGVKAVMGHEIGHYVLNHSVSILLMIGVLLAGSFALMNVLFKALTKNERWGVRGIEDPAGMPLAFAILSFVFALATPINNNITRYHESQADYFGVNASREPDGFAESAVLLSEYRKMAPSPFEEWFFYDHPSGWQRIHMSMQWKANEIAVGRLPPSPGGPPPGWRPDFVVMHQGAQNAPRATAASPAAPSD